MEKEVKKIYLEQIPESFTKKNIDPRKNTLDKCFLTDDNRVFKKLKDMNPYIKEYEFLAKQSSKTFIFPDELVFLKKGDDFEFCGYLMEYIQGNILRTQKRDIQLSNLIKAMQVLETSIKNDISLNSVEINDLNLGNIIYTENNTLKVIDTDLYDYNSTPRLQDLYIKNIREYNNSIMAFIFENLACYDSHNIDLLKEINKYTIYGEIKASEMLKEYQYILSEYFQEEIKTLNQMDKKLALIRK